MAISEVLKERCQGICELCNANDAVTDFPVSPRNADLPQNNVAVCETCAQAMQDDGLSYHWRCIEGSMWNPNEVVQVLSYRILNKVKEQEWAAQFLSSFDLDEDLLEWALDSSHVKKEHKDAFGNILQNGDNVVLVQALDVKGTNLTASKGTVVKRIKLISDDAGQVEGKINEQTIVLLTKFLKKI